MYALFVRIPFFTVWRDPKGNQRGFLFARRFGFVVCGPFARRFVCHTEFCVTILVAAGFHGLVNEMFMVTSSNTRRIYLLEKSQRIWNFFFFLLYFPFFFFFFLMLNLHFVASTSIEVVFYNTYRDYFAILVFFIGNVVWYLLYDKSDIFCLLD